MQAIILAAGMGKRLKGLTSDNTKCMIKVNGITLIERMLTQLDDLNLNRIVLVVGYKSNNLIDYIKTLQVNTPIEYVENPDYYKTNNIYSLFLARDYMKKDDTLLLESDLIFDDCILKELIDDPSPSLALVAPYESWMDGTVVTLHSDNRIRDFLDNSHFQFADIKSYYKTVNIYKFSRSFSENQYVPFLEAYCQALGKNEYYEQVLKVITMLNKSELWAKILEHGNWYEIDDIQDLDIAESIFVESDADRIDRIQKRYGGYWRYPQMLDFCYLANPYFPPQRLLDEIKANFETLVVTYPSGQWVNNLLSGKYFGVSVSRIIAGNGAAELIKSLLEQIPGNIGVILPTFEEYPNRKTGKVIAYKPDNEDYTYTADILMEYFDNKLIDALIVVNPDNPSGNYIPHDDILRLAEWAERKNIKLVIDESFVDFADTSDTMLVDKYLTEYPHLIVVKSISKSYGVPGIRLGILACGDETLLESVRKDLPIWNINSVAEFYLQICEKYKSDFVEAMRQFYPVRDELYADLKKISFLEPLPSKANFIMCRLTGKISASALTEFLLMHHNILIKDLSSKNGISGKYVRIAVRTSRENKKLIEALLEFQTH
jgi:histidinol-phosphate/aromatic aminotransferase/cobyric acid decarboxylase-like protein/choline kinase